MRAKLARVAYCIFRGTEAVPQLERWRRWEGERFSEYPAKFGYGGV